MVVVSFVLCASACFGPCACVLVCGCVLGPSLCHSSDASVLVMSPSKALLVSSATGSVAGLRQAIASMDRTTQSLDEEDEVGLRVVQQVVACIVLTTFAWRL